MGEPNFFGQYSGTLSSSDSDASTSDSDHAPDPAQTHPPKDKPTVQGGADVDVNPPKSKLPSFSSALTSEDGIPRFLNPSSTRLAATYAPHHTDTSRANQDDVAQTTTGKKRRCQDAGQDFDISKIAPPLPGQREPDKSVVQAKATRGAGENGGMAGDEVQYSEAQIALMGGKPASDQTKVKTKSTDVEQFVSKGGGGSLPRHSQGRKEQERVKRARGQSSHSEWKSEAEMQQRQLFDS